MLKRIKDFLFVKEVTEHYGSLGDLTGGEKVHYRRKTPTFLGLFVRKAQIKISGLIYDIRHPGERDNF